MAETPTPETKSDAKPSTPVRARRAVLVDAGLEAMSLVALAFIAVGFSAYAGRREISRELALAWLNDKGIEASLDLEDLDATGFAGAIRLGPKNAPVFSAERIEVAYDLSTPWSGDRFALNTRAVRLVRPRLTARLDRNGLNFGALQPLIDAALKSPSEPATPGPAVLIEDARVLLVTPGGSARLTGDASLDDGQLLRFDGRLAPLRYATKDLSFETDGVLVRARKRGDRLTLDAQMDLKALSAGQLDLTEAAGTLQADLTYPDLKKLSMVGPAEVRLALKARGAEVESASLGGLEANLNVSGLLSGDFKRGGLTGKATLHARGERLTAQALDSREVVADLDLSKLAVTYDPSGARGSAATRLSATAERAVAGGAALSRSSIEVSSSSLTMISDSQRSSISGPLTVALGGGRVAEGGVVLSSLAADGKGRFSAGTDGLSLVLDGYADADGAMTGPDAQRVTLALPNPAYALAASKALSSFVLSAPALHLGITGGQTSLSLPRPITVVTTTGAKATLSAPGGPLVATRGDTADGRLVLALGGGGLPAITLKAPNWRSGPSGLSSDVIVAGTIDVPPFIGVSGTLAGRAQMASKLAGEALTIRLNGCTPMTAKAIAMGEPPISEVKFDLCPTAAPLVLASGGVWRASADIKDGQALVNVAQARLGGVTAGFVGGGRGFDVAQIKVIGGRIVEASTEGKRFETIAATGEVDLARGQWTGGLNATTLDGHPLGKVTIRHDVASGRGQADIDASRLVFAKGGLQPLGLTPLAVVARDAEGPAAFTGRFAWADDVMTSEGRITTPGLDFKSPLGQVHKLKGAVVFDSLAPLTSPAGQTLTLDSVDAIVPIQGVTASFGLGAEAMHLQSAAFEASKGRVTIEPLDVPLDGKGVIKGVINIAGLDLGQLVSGSSLAEKVKVEAVVDGRLPFEYSPAGFKIFDGKVYATGPGRLSIAREALTGVDAGQGSVDPNDPLTVKKDVPVNAIQDFAYQAMENLHFDTLEAGVNSTDKGRLGVLFHIKGEHDPKIVEKAKIGLMELLNGSAFQRRIPLPAKTPVDLTLDTSLNFDELLAAWKRGWQESEPEAPATPTSTTPPVPASVSEPTPRSDAVQP